MRRWNAALHTVWGLVGVTGERPPLFPVHKKNLAGYFSPRQSLRIGKRGVASCNLGWEAGPSDLGEGRVEAGGSRAREAQGLV